MKRTLFILAPMAVMAVIMAMSLHVTAPSPPTVTTTTRITAIDGPADPIPPVITAINGPADIITDPYLVTRGELGVG